MACLALAGRLVKRGLMQLNPCVCVCVCVCERERGRGRGREREMCVGGWVLVERE